MCFLQIYKYLIELFDIMAKIRNNQGVSLDNLYTPRPPEFVPPFTIFAPWYTLIDTKTILLFSAIFYVKLKFCYNPFVCILLMVPYSF
jgi:hypothetical protein